MSGTARKLLKIIGLGAGGFLLCLALSAALPGLVQEILPGILAGHGLPVSLDVRSIGFSGSDFSGLAIGPGKPLVRVDSIRLDYSPAGLLRKKISRLALSGVAVDLVVANGRLVLPWPTAGQPGQGPAGDRDTPLEYLAHFGEISIEQAVVNIQYNQARLAIPCSLRVQADPANPRQLAGRLSLLVRGQPVSVRAELDLDSQALRAELAAGSVDLRRFADLLPVGPGLAAAGILGLQAEARVGLNPLQVRTAGLTGRLAQAEISLAGMRLTTITRPGPTASEMDQPFSFSLSAAGEGGRLTSTYLALAGRPAAEIGGLDLALARTAGGASLDGQFTVRIPAPAQDAPLAVRPLELVTALHGQAGWDGGWSVQARALARDLPLEVSGPGFELAARINEYTLTGSGRAAQSDLTYSLALANVRLAAGGTGLSLPEVMVQGRTANGRSTLLLPFEQLAFQDAHTGLSGVAQGRVPFSWPYQPGLAAGELAIPDLRLAAGRLGSLQLSLAQVQSGLSLAGRFRSALAADSCIELAGQVDLPAAGPGAAMTFHNACDKSVQGLDLGRLSPSAAGFVVDADLELGGSLGYENGRLAGKLDTRIDNIRLVSRTKDLTLEGGSLELHLTELPGIKTGPRQRFSFERLRFGKIIAEQGLVEFQVESPESIFIEKSAVQWSGGQVSTQALRFSPKIRDYELTFFCDRLNFAQVLAQLGAASADGQGRVNGRVPVRITDGRFFLENGFLYSTPGEGGTIRLTQAEILKAGIPRDTPQFAQVDLASEALKDFTYDWTKLDINSQGEDDLLLHLQVNGKPANPLPFVYSQEFGGFMRVDAASPGSRFQGIKLDVNFRLPLNRVLRYGDTIKSMVQ